MDYSILWEEKTPVPISSVNLKTTHEHIIEEMPTPAVEAISISTVEEIPTPSIINKETISENLEEKPQTQDEDVVSSTNDILASYRNIAKRYKS